MGILIGPQDIGVAVDGDQEAAYVSKARALSPYSYFILGEHLGTVAYDCMKLAQSGAHVSVTLGQVGIGDGQVCPFYDGANSHTNIYTAGGAAAFNGSAGTISIWAKVSAVGDWTDGTQRTTIRFAVDANNYIELVKLVGANLLQWGYRAGGVTKSVNLGGLATVDWMHMALTWDSVADEVKALGRKALPIECDVSKKEEVKNKGSIKEVLCLYFLKPTVI